MTSKVTRTIFIILLLVLPFVIWFLYASWKSKKSFSVTYARQELSKKLLEKCNNSTELCPKNLIELKVFAPKLFKQVSQYKLPTYTFRNRSDWILTVKFNDYQYAVHDSTSKSAIVGKIYGYPK